LPTGWLLLLCERQGRQECDCRGAQKG
jgi:hypothetical protein